MGIYEQLAYIPCMTNMSRVCFIVSDGNLLLFGSCMNRIGCVSITCYTLLKQTIFAGPFHVLKRLCNSGNKHTIYMRTISKMATTNMTSQVICSLTLLYVFTCSLTYAFIITFFRQMCKATSFKTHINHQLSLGKVVQGSLKMS